MAIYDFKCPECDTVCRDVVLPMMHEDDEHPHCHNCDAETHHYITKTPMMFMRDVDYAVPFQAGKKKEVITGSRQRKEFMARNNLMDANEIMEKPTHEEQQKTIHEVNESIAAITPTKRQKEEMKASGLGDIVE